MSSSGPAYTDCTLWNLSGGAVNLEGKYDCHGHGDPPKTIPNGKSGHFVHMADAVGSVAVVAYTLVVNNIGNNLRWVTAWSNLIGNPQNKVFTKLERADITLDWKQIKTALDHSGSASFGFMNGYASFARIDQNTDTPKMVSILTKVLGDEQNTDTPNLASILNEVE